MNEVLMVLVFGALLLLMASLVVTALKSLAVREGPPASPPAVGLRARLICPETGAPTRVRLGVGKREQGDDPVVLACERFAAGPLTCDQGCLVRNEEEVASRV